MIRANSSCAQWFRGRLPIALGFALSLAVASPACYAGKPPERLAWRGEEQSEELEGSFEDRVHDLQGWLRQRDAERRQSTWGNDVVAPDNRALNPPPRYYGRDYDPQGYRRLNENTRFRLRTEDPSWSLDSESGEGSSRRPSPSLHDSQDDAAAAAGDSDRPETGSPMKRRVSAGKHKRRVRHR